MKSKMGYSIKNGWVLCFCLLVVWSSCFTTNRQEQSGDLINANMSGESQLEKTDSVAIVQAFEQLQMDTAFLRVLGLENEMHPERLFNPAAYRLVNENGPDGNGLSECALLFYVVEGAGVSNNWTAYYGLFSKAGDRWVYETSLPASILAVDLLFKVDTLYQGGEIKGHWVFDGGGKDVKYGATYMLKEGTFINSFTELHRSIVQEGYLYIDHLLLTDNQSLSLTGNQKDYETILGKGKIETPEDQLVCGTYFEEEGLLRYVSYPNMKFELNGNGKMALMEIDMRGSDIIIQTSIGSINAQTTYDEIVNCFDKKDDFQLFDDNEGSANAEGSKSIRIPTGPEADDTWEFTFDAKGRIIHFSHFIPC